MRRRSLLRLLSPTSRSLTRLRRSWRSLGLVSLLAAAAATCSGDDRPEVMNKWVDEEVFPGLAAEVEVLIDTQGIPHIYAHTDYDVMYAAGYQAATDRLFQMDLLRRRALGRQAEVLGEEKLSEDTLSRLMDFPRWGREGAARMKAEEPESYRLFVSWVAGVNARIDEIQAGAAPLPYGFGAGELNYAPESWENSDPFVIAKLFMFGNSTSLENEMLATVVERLTPELLEAIELPRPARQAFTVPPEDRPLPSARQPTQARLRAEGAKPAPLIIDPARAEASLRRFTSLMSAFRVQGSNNWAVAGRFTANGRPLICNDPHQPLQSPSLMYALHLNTADQGGTLDVVGFGFAGSPGVQLGHNKKVQWAATTGFADVMDLWSITLSEDETTANVAGTQAPVVVRQETIRVKDQGERSIAIREVPGYGLLVDDYLLEEVLLVDPGKKALFNWTGFRPTSEPSAFVAMMKAGSVSEFEAAVDKMEVGTFNFISADAADISYRVNVLIPDRGDPSARPMPLRVVDGADVGSFWSGAWLPPEKLPRSRAPITGFVATANNDPWGFTGDGDVGNDPWYYGTYYDPGYRGQRIEDELKRLTASGGITPEAMQTLQTDVRSLLAESMIPALKAAFAKIESDDSLAEFRGKPALVALHSLITEEWDGMMRRDSSGALAFHVWVHLLSRGVIADDLGGFLYDTILDASAVYLLKFVDLAVNGGYPNGEQILQGGRDRLLLSALAETEAWLSSNFGSSAAGAYTWGDRHGTDFRNSFGGDLYGGWVPTDGGEDTVNVSSTSFQDSNGQVAGRFDSTDGAIFRITTGFDEDGTPRSWLNFPRGNSGDPESKHWADTLEDWVEGRYLPLAFSREEVEAVRGSSVTIKPEA
ncbi:MAG: penicillin acylase family protein [Nannocystis sp.]|nr:penicillin acylase family protein [Nannocystis sp.]